MYKRMTSSESFAILMLPGEILFVPRDSVHHGYTFTAVKRYTSQRSLLVSTA